MREKIGLESETVDLSDDIATPAQLVDWLIGRGPAYAEAFANREKMRCAIDQLMSPFNASLKDAREVAFFPPVTGG